MEKFFSNEVESSDNEAGLSTVDKNTTTELKITEYDLEDIAENQYHSNWEYARNY